MAAAPSRLTCSAQLWRDPDWRALTDQHKRLFFERVEEAMRHGAWPGLPPDLQETFEAIRRRNLRNITHNDHIPLEEY